MSEVRLLRIFEISIAALNIFLNLYFIAPTTVGIITTGGGGFGIGLFILPFLLAFHAMLIPGIVTLIKHKQGTDYYIANICGVFCSIAFYQFFGN